MTVVIRHDVCDKIEAAIHQDLVDHDATIVEAFASLNSVFIRIIEGGSSNLEERFQALDHIAACFENNIVNAKMYFTEVDRNGEKQ